MLKDILFSLFMIVVALRPLQNWAILERPRIKLGQCIQHSLNRDTGMAWLEEQLFWGGVCRYFAEKGWNASDKGL